MLFQLCFLGNNMIPAYGEYSPERIDSRGKIWLAACSMILPRRKGIRLWNAALQRFLNNFHRLLMLGQEASPINLGIWPWRRASSRLHRVCHRALVLPVHHHRTAEGCSLLPPLTTKPFAMLPVCDAWGVQLPCLLHCSTLKETTSVLMILLDKNSLGMDRNDCSVTQFPLWFRYGVPNVNSFWQCLCYAFT